MNCLILGGDGFIGSAIAEYLLLQGVRVRVYDHSKPHLKNLNHIKQDIEVVFGDFTTEGNFSSLLQNVDYVFHTVCTTLPTCDNPVLDVEENVIPTLKLLDACRKGNVRKVIFLSSGGTVYGLNQLDCISETHATEPICFYGVQKLTIEKYLHACSYLYGLDYAVMRVSNPYGERQDPFKPQGVIAAFLARAILNRPIEIWGDGSVVRDYLHVSDVAKAALLITRHDGPDKVFNIGSGRGHSLNEIIDCIEKVINQEILRVYMPGRKYDVPFNVIDITKASRILGWLPQVQLEMGIKQMAEAWRLRYGG